jgi:hypothetical protein
MGKPSKNLNHKKIEGKENKNHKGEFVYYGEHYSVHTRQYHATTKKFIEIESQRMIDWANLEDSLLIQDFYNKGGYSMRQFYDWCDKFPEFKEAHEYAMSMLGSRRELGALTRRFDAGTVHRTLGAYSKIWREQTRELAQMKEDAASHEAKVIVIERFPIPSGRSPEQVAQEIHNNTANCREYGPKKFVEGMEE